MLKIDESQHNEANSKNEKDIEAFTQYITAIGKSFAERIKEHPRAKDSINRVVELCIGVINKYIMTGEAPDIQILSPEEIQKNIVIGLSAIENLKRKRPKG